MKPYIYKRFIGLDSQLIKENPDSIIVDNKSYWWFQKNAIPFMILSDTDDNNVLIYASDPISHKRILEIIFNTLMVYKKDLAYLIENDILDEYALGVVKNNTDSPHLNYKDIGSIIKDYSRNVYEDGFVYGRVWNIQDVPYVSIWENPESSVQYKQLLINFLQEIGANPSISQWEIRSGDDNDFSDSVNNKLVSMDEFFNDTTEQKPIMKPPHTVPGLGKALGIQAPGFGSYKQAEIASKLKMPFAQYHAMVSQESVDDVL